MSRFDEEVVLSPCVSVCKMDPTRGDAEDRAGGGLCVGCLRTIDEIIEWGTATSVRKQQIISNVDARRAA